MSTSVIKDNVWQILIGVCIAGIIGVVTFGLGVYRNDALQDAQLEAIEKQLDRYDPLSDHVSKIRGEVEAITKGLESEKEARGEFQKVTREALDRINNTLDDIQRYLRDRK